jgi:hypothetical protein
MAFTEKHNELFGPGPHDMLNACVGENGGPASFGKIGTGYFIAGRKLIESVIDEDRHLDQLIYPVVFCYRHGVELYLKHLIKELDRISKTKPIELNHRLSENFKNVKDGFENLLDPEEHKSLFEQIGAVVKYLGDVDPEGMAFRYHEDKNGTPYLNGITHINIVRFGNQMEEAVARLEFLINIVWNIV